MIRYLAPFLIIFAIGCARSPVKGPGEAMRPTKKALQVSDDLPLKGLIQAIIQSIEKFKKAPNKPMKFGGHQISQGEYARALESIVEAAENFESKKDFYSYMESNWELHEVYGKKDWSQVLVTSYYDPVIEGSLRKTKRFNQPLYLTPKDMVFLDIDEYAKRFEKWRTFTEDVLEQKSRKAIVRGRLTKSGKYKKVVPYFDRQEIDEGSALKGRGLELVYVDPIDAFFLQIQGSGTVSLGKGKELRVGYASQNGHPYVAIGKHLLDVIPIEEMSMQKIEDHLRSIGPEKTQDVLNLNPSYVFFRKLKGASQTFMETDVIAGRTIATDYGFFPKGALAFLEFPSPKFVDGQKEPKEFKNTRRFVVDHDTGGAIRGPGRLDLYWGKGAEAEKHAGVMRHPGKLFYLFPKIEESQVAANSNGG